MNDTTELPPTDQQIARMRSVILSEIASTRKPHRRLAIAGALAIGTALVAGAAAIAITQATPREMNYSVDCYTTTNLADAHGTTMLIDGAATELMPLEERIASALETCHLSWNAVPTEPLPGWAPTVVINPTVCQLRDGRLGVFPNEDDLSADTLCRRIGVMPPTT